MMLSKREMHHISIHYHAPSHDPISFIIPTDYFTVLFNNVVRLGQLNICLIDFLYGFWKQPHIKEELVVSLHTVYTLVAYELWYYQRFFLWYLFMHLLKTGTQIICFLSDPTHNKALLDQGWFISIYLWPNPGTCRHRCLYKQF